MSNLLQIDIGKYIFSGWILMEFNSIQCFTKKNYIKGETFYTFAEGLFARIQAWSFGNIIKGSNVEPIKTESSTFENVGEE